jgi:peptidoglycan/LPS O-acetylase OafA/YrhL
VKWIVPGETESFFMSQPRSAQASSTPRHVEPTPDANPVSPAPRGLKLIGRRPALDGVRGIAILMVLAFHFLPGDLTASPHTLVGTWAAVANFGGGGVDLFFVLSGFLITGILLDEQKTAGYFRNFYARRALRIFPLYYGVLFACFILLPIVHRFSPEEQALAQRQGWLWTYTANILAGRFPEWMLSGGRLSFDHIWSLCVEEHFYLIWPLATFLLSRRALAWCCVAMIAAAPALRWALYARGDPTLAFYVWTPCRMDGMAMGALLALLAQRSDGGAGSRRWALPMFAITITWIALTWNDPARGLVYATSQMTLASAAVIVLAATSGPRHPLTRLLTAAPLTFFGKYSYAIYVLHPLLRKNLVAKIMSLQAVRSRIATTELNRTVTLLALGLITSAIVGWLSWHVFEKHFLKLKRFFEYRHGTQSTPVALKAQPHLQAAE